VEGQNIAIEYRWAEGKLDRLHDLAAELSRLKVDVIVTGGLPASRAAQKATSTTPIVAVAAADPATSGLVASLARPGGNVTGLTVINVELSGKRLELLKEAVPRISHVAVLRNLGNSTHALIWQKTQLEARPLKLRLQSLEVRGPDELESAFGAMTKKRVNALILAPDEMFFAQRR
jgi:putative ABC transport system substrate-binding protein